MRLTLILLSAALALSACGIPDDRQIVSAPAADPYVTGPGGVAVYQGDVNMPGTRLPGDAAPAAPAPGTEFAAVGTTVYFGESAADLSDEARRTLTRQAAWLTQNSAYAAVIEGHADEPGTREFNLALGARRATSVREYLVANGVAPGRIRTLSYGKERPASICGAEPSCLERNRRAVTQVSQSQAGV
ncbi:peptidoglycan-associated lipoprotein [Paracoccus isoporae]|uniref:Peptidoglycan-associated lipoprotein n=1 Tax=Paracoccus isoporae TaxID=591205 RepID=A0A1G6YRJ5_9RHOB|nr:OmpA family protein [Paracoccus isoporae]SDD92988.1 peptidoglycan-associated lipoprotein [Paracoccus isoporae]